MSIFRTPASGIITKGLGLAACCGFLAVGFGVINCRIEIGGGGGSFPVYPEIYREVGQKIRTNKKRPLSDRTVKITVKMKHKQWNKTMVISSTKADILVSVLALSNNIKRTIGVAVRAIRKSSARLISAVTTKFK